MNRFANAILSRTRKANDKGLGYVVGAGYRKQFHTEAARLVESGRLVSKKDGLYYVATTRGTKNVETPAKAVRKSKKVVVVATAPVTPAPVVTEPAPAVAEVVSASVVGQ